MMRRLKNYVFEAVAPWLLAKPRKCEKPLDLKNAKHPIVVAGFFQTASGIGKSAQLAVHALKAKGIEPVCVDLSAVFNQVDMESPHALSSIPDTAEGTLILHVNAPETMRALWLLGFRGARRHWHVIGYWAWELPEMPESWMSAQEWLSEVWVPSQFVLDGFAGRDRIPVVNVPHEVVLPDDISSNKKLPHVFTILSMADGRSSLERKNISASIKAFRSAFPKREVEEVRLVLKMRNVSLEQISSLENEIDNDPRISILNSSLPLAEQYQLIADSDLFLSLHRSEGFGLVIAEALAMGKQVVATNWSGGDDFIKHENFRPVSYSLIPVTGKHIYASQQNWADADMQDAVRNLREAYDFFTGQKPVG